VRYLVASKRYEVTKEIRGIIRSHFEDAFKSPEQVHDVAKELRKVAEHISATVEVLLDTSASSSGLSSAVTRIGAGLEGSSKPSNTFDRIWKIKAAVNDQEVVNFCSWSVLLLHLMVHKAFGVLYHPLFRDPAMISDTRLRTRSIPTPNILTYIKGLTS
jgi:hypothetical protein